MQHIIQRRGKIHGWFRMAILLLLPGPFLAGCNPPADKQAKPSITVSILPQKYFLERISGGQFDITVMIPPGESPATYDPTSDQMVKMASSDLYFLIGHIQFENAWIMKMKGEYPGIRFIDTSRGVDVEELEHEGHDHAHHGVDPHIWMSVPRVKQIASTMAEALGEAYPEKQDVYTANLGQLQAELDSLHASIRNELAGLRGGKFIIYHPALTYFAGDYGLVQIPIEQEGKEPTARYLRSLIDHAVSEGISAILIQKQFNQQEARTIEQEIGGRIIVIDPLDENWPQQMNYIAVELKKALKAS